MLNISAKTEYACVAVFELARHHHLGEPVPLRSIAEAHGIPSPFLVQILLQLKTAGLVKSTRGAAGGYRLALPPDAISLADVMSVIEGHTATIESSIANPTPSSTALHNVWQELADKQYQRLASITLASLVESLRPDVEHMYYI